MIGEARHLHPRRARVWVCVICFLCLVWMETQLQAGRKDFLRFWSVKETLLGKARDERQPWASTTGMVGQAGPCLVVEPRTLLPNSALTLPLSLCQMHPPPALPFPTPKVTSPRKPCLSPSQGLCPLWSPFSTSSELPCYHLFPPPKTAN